ncbi:hypothetical protein FGO68_gene6423 [Halteria grandinella]|uniref:Fibronectin type-III domain-containing protein n=1 Tax=Halteria grandinella TaxID=5974 RepID=A0A8J8SYJ2_HALGN|nr:hypothetical protein FGO68_gene6423 [Halteria grandinella]
MNSISTSPQWSVSVISVKISVSLPQNNGAAVNSYIVKIKPKTGSTYFTELVSCDGSSPTFVSTRECLIPHATLRAAPFNLVKGDSIIGIVNAANIKGYNASYSNPNSATAYVEDVPDKMGSVTRNTGQTWSTQFTMYFTAQNQYTTAAGGQTCQILSYHVQRDQGNNTNNGTADVWTDLKGLASNDTSTSVTATAGIVGGTTYKVRVRSLNKHGWGPWASVVNIRAAAVPNAPPSVSTTNSTLWIIISWTEPFNNGLNITQYKVEILRKVGTWSTNSECDATTNQTIIANRQCYITMQALRSTTYGYAYSEVPVFRVSAYNLETWGNSQQTSGGASIQTEPAQPAVVMTNNVAATNDLQIQVYWTAITGIANWKGYEVHAYEVWWQDKDGTFAYELLYNDTKPFQLTYTHKNKGSTPDVGDTSYPTQAIVGGTRYKFKYRAVNIHGPGPYSTEVLFYASTIPDKLDPATTSLLNSTVTIAWLPTPNDHKQTVTAYRVKVRNKAGTFVEDTAICNGVKAAVVSSLKCSAAMLLFTTNLNLAIDDLIVVQVEAMNVMGYSIASNSNTDGITAKKLPQTAPSSLSRGVNTGKTVVHLNWVGITANVDTGGQDVDYKVYFDKSTGGTSWYTLTDTTTNLTTYTDSSSFGVGKAYQFKVAAFNDFGVGPQSTAFTVWAAIAPSGLADPTTTLNLLTYVEEDDIILIDWVPPTDDGGLAVSYKIEVMNSVGAWLEVDQPNECSEKGTITNYFLPQATTANAVTQCSMLISKLKSRWGLAIGNTVLARITAFQVVGSVTTTLSGAGTAVIPDPPCFRTTFPRIIGGTNSQTSILAIDVDSLGNIVAGGYSQDSGLLGKTATSTLPIVHYIAKGNYYAWGKYIETSDGVSATLFTTILDITFRYDGQKIALVLDRANYAAAYTVVVLNVDGSLYGAFKEGTNQKGKVNITGTLFDNSNFITLAVDASQDGSDSKKYAQIVRFSVANPSASSITPAFYIQGGAINRISQSIGLLRIKSDITSIYASALIQDTTQNRRTILAKVTLSSGAVTKYFHYTTQPVTADYNTDTTMATIRRMSLYEDDLTTLQIVGACIVSQDGYRIHFGQFIFSTNQLFTVLTSSVVNRWYCLGMFQRTANTAYTLYNDRSLDSPTGYTLYYGKIDYNNKKIDSIPVLNHDGPNTYYGAFFVHSARFYYWGDTNKVKTSSTFNYAQQVGFLNIYDQQETLSCTSGSQVYNFASAPLSITLDAIVSANMNWVTTGYTSGPNFAAQTGKNFKPFALTGGLFVLNLKEPISNNTFCPIVTNPTPATVQGPVIPKTMLSYDPDASSYPNQEVSFTPFTVSKTCPDQVNYYSTFIADDSSPLPAFMLFDPSNTKYIFSINNPQHVGTYNMILQATIGNNKTTQVVFTVQVASPCLGLTINVPVLASPPTYDISDLVPTYVDLNWQVVSPPTPSCGEINFMFKMFNNTPGGVVDTNIFSIVNTTNGLQRIKIWTQSIPAAKTWTDLKIEARLQGDVVKNYVFTIIITNKCALTQINPVVITDQIYYTGRDAIDYSFVWPETVGVCGPITYSANEYLAGTPSSNNSLDAGVFAYPKPSGGNNTLRIYTWDDSKVGIYQVRVWASLGVGGFQQSSTIFNVQIIKDPCSYFPYVTSFAEDLTLWINQTDQVALIPPYVMNDTAWSCNFTYEIRTGTGAALDSAFVLRETVLEGAGPNLTLVTTDKTKVDLSPQVVRVRGWPKRQNTTSQQFTFRIFVAYLDKSDCPSGQYYNTASELCLNCNSPCITCKGSATTCTWCIPGYTFIDSTSTCVQTTALTECPLGTIKDAYMGFCRSCPDFCTACSSTDNCTACVRNYYLATTNNVNYGCFSPKSCPAGYRMDDAQGCLPCSSNCASCPSATVCNLCKDTYYLDTLTNQCTQTCPNGYYGDAASKVCMMCSPACKTCVTNNYTCTSCNDIGATKYYLYESTCVTRCPYIGYFQNQPARTCVPCKSACKICVNAFDDCIVCNPGSVISGRECLNSCPEGYYITVIGTCFQCDPACSRCQGSQNSMCSECVPGQYLTQTTCESKCNNPLFPDNPTKSCLACPYYCNQCTNANNCMKCKTGYQQLPQDCLGEMFLRVNTSMSLTAPINSALVSETFDPTSAAFEIWFKADNIFSMYQEIILGLSPYKMRKKNGVAQVQLNFGDNNYCDSKNLKSNQWYHFAVSMTEENGGALNCYIDGETIAVGQIPVATIATNIQKFKEVSFGTSVDIKTSESRFNGYLKEFRWWKKTRSQFQITKFRFTAITTLSDFNPPNELLAYWKFDEKRSQTSFIDFASKGSLSYDPTPTGFKLADLMEMREIYLKMCPEGTFIYFNETLGYYNCTACHESCGNCDAETSTSCTSCISPYKLLETEQKCIITADCPAGYYQDANKNCWPCHPYCTDCYGGDQYQCTACQKGYFKAYKRAGCVDSCPRGLYGNYLTQSCSANPKVTSLYPEDNLVVQYGEFIDLFATAMAGQSQRLVTQQISRRMRQSHTLEKIYSECTSIIILLSPISIITSPFM